MKKADKELVLKHLKVAQAKYHLQYTSWRFGPDLAGRIPDKFVAEGKAKQARQKIDYDEVTALIERLS